MKRQKLGLNQVNKHRQKKFFHITAMNPIGEWTKTSIFTPTKNLWVEPKVPQAKPFGIFIGKLGRLRLRYARFIFHQRPWGRHLKERNFITMKRKKRLKGENP